MKYAHKFGARGKKRSVKQRGKRGGYAPKALWNPKSGSERVKPKRKRLKRGMAHRLRDITKKYLSSDAYYDRTEPVFVADAWGEELRPENDSFESYLHECFPPIRHWIRDLPE
jgi:hypothetical protein